MRHLSPEEQSAHLDGALAGAARDRVERHLAECKSCREALARLAGEDAALRSALDYDPGEAYFETFAARVEDRMRAAGLKGAQSRLAGGGLFGWLSSPRRLAWVGAVAAVVAGAGVVMLTSRPERPYPGSRLSRPIEQGAPATPGIEAPSSPSPDLPGGALRAQETDRAPLVHGEASPPPMADALGDRAGSRDRLAVTRDEAGIETGGEKREGTRPSAPATRLMEARRIAGEDVPVKPEGAAFASPPPQSAAAEGAAQVVKPRAAQPMEQRAPVASTVPGAPGALVGSATGETRLCGQVVDPGGRAVAGAVVALADLGRSTATDAAGRFCLAAPAGAHSLTVMAVGFAESRLQVRTEGPSAEVTVTLRPVSVLDQGLRALGSLRGEAKGLLSERPVGVFSTLPESLRVRASSAERLGSEARTQRSAARYDTAAAEWEAVVNGAAEAAARLEARYRLAEARVRAWELGPSSLRAAAARRALDAYLAVAPPGSQRDQALRWRGRLD